MARPNYTVARADDRALITAVLHKYCYLARDEADWDAIAELYTPEAEFKLQDGTAFDRHHISNVVRGEEAAYIRHHATTIDIRFDEIDPGHAYAETFFMANTDEAAPDHWGYWKDEFQRQTDGTWLIADRMVVAEGAAPEGWMMRVYSMEIPDEE